MQNTVIARFWGGGQSSLSSFPGTESFLKNFKNNAFTLAEVLVTVAIIGIVAALTLPQLIQKNEKKAAITGIKKAYTELYQVIIRSQAENGEPAYWDFDNRNDFPDKYLIPYMKVIKDCGRSGPPLFCYYEDNNEKNKLHVLDGTVENFNTGYRGLILANGMGILIRLGWGAGAAPFAKIYVDINGPKGSTTIGKDVFAFSMRPDKGDKYIFLTGVTGANNSGVNNSSFMKTREYLMSTVQGGCNKDAISSTGYNQGDFCSALIQIDGWQIKDDYPW